MDEEVTAREHLLMPSLMLIVIMMRLPLLLLKRRIAD